MVSTILPDVVPSNGVVARRRRHEEFLLDINGHPSVVSLMGTNRDGNGQMKSEVNEGEEDHMNQNDDGLSDISDSEVDEILMKTLH
ncbi:unnamed protein product [Rotaria sp. Silwood2]|nr:unnamed protein product [Rotaria sp. Silwood2]CAF3069316.1 unnamed protein product [Rotaria sp. Silwood2]CAF3378528.1 unnamed protein product [Rotaria sp. Silwood2]CAF4310441.1 unnamed protein product [Rotaria sp. Silwood2]